MSVKTLSVPCPTCKKEVIMTEASAHRPFCSKRCRDIDFGDWANGSHAIPGDETESDTWSEDLNNLSE